MIAVAEETKLYGPRGAAKELFYRRDSELLLEGPAGTGKSRAVLEKINRWLLKQPGSRALIVRKTRASMTESVLVTYEDKVVPDNPEFYPDTHSTLRRLRQSYVYPNGSALVVGGMDNPDRIMSTEFDMIAAFEATELSEDDWEKLTTRLRNGVMPFQQAIADCNPSSPSHWLNQRANAKRMARLLSRHEDNPVLHDGTNWTEQGQRYLDRLEALTGPRFMRLRKGVWAAAEGLVYEEYDPAIHLIKPFEIPATWRRIRVIDFGYTNPFVCLWIAFDEDDRAYVYRQIYMTKRLVQDHATKIKELSGAEKYETTISDHDAEDRATFEKYCGPTKLATKEIKPGIEAFSLRLRKAGDGKARFFIMRDSLVEKDQSLADAKLPTCTEEEFDGYTYPKAGDGKPVKEEPIKINDHGMDCCRYMAMHRKLQRRKGEVILMSH